MRIKLLLLFILANFLVFSQTSINFTAVQISVINLAKTASQGDIYIDTNNNIYYLGVTDGTLKIIGNVGVNGLNQDDGIVWNTATNTWEAAASIVKVYHVAKTDTITTVHKNDSLVTDLTFTPPLGTYLLFFNAKHSIIPLRPPFSSNQAKIDMDSLGIRLTNLTATATHPLAFGAGEVLAPGIYDVAGAGSITGTLTLDGGGDPNSIFVIRCASTFTTGASTTNVILTNGASSSNIFWTAPGAISTGTSTIMKGNLVSYAGAVSLGTNTNLEGRMLTKAGAIALAAGCVVTVPSGSSPFYLGVLYPLGLWTSLGAVSDDVTSSTTGDIGTYSGAMTIVGSHVGVEYTPGSVGVFPIPITTYSIYINGIIVPNSTIRIDSKSLVVTIHGLVTILTIGDTIEIRWKVDGEKATLDHRTLSLVRSQY
jgi:hypothetical protein